MTPAIRAEWRERIAAEYTSAAITQHFVHWLMIAGAPPDLLDDGLAIVADELVHARLSHEVFTAAGGGGAPALEPSALALARRSPDLIEDLAREGLRVFCIGETIAVPLFQHLRAACSEPVARAALDRILVDEVRHRDFGWDVLDWLIAAHGDRVVALVRAELPTMATMLDAQYGLANEAVAADAPFDERARAWGLAAPRDYADILRRAIEGEFRQRFATRNIPWP